MTEHRADGAVDVADRQLDRHRLSRRGSPAARDGSAPGRAPRRGRGPAAPTGAASARRGCSAWRGSARGRGRAPSSGRPPAATSSTSTWPIISAIVRKPSCGHQLAHLLGDELEEVDDELGLAAEALAQLGVLRGDADRAGVEVADAHHHAARHDERRGGEAELLGAEQRGDHDVAPGLQLAVGLHDDAVAQAVAAAASAASRPGRAPTARRRA